MKLVVSLKAPTFAELSRTAREKVRGADLVELRLDGFPPPREAELRILIRQFTQPVIVTVQGPEAFGSFQGSDEQRLELLRSAARAGARYVDVDQSLAARLGALPAGTTRLVSRHVTESTPADLPALLVDLRLLAGKDDPIKLVTHAASAEDGLRLLAALAQASGPRIGFCSGEIGRFTRILCGLHGSEWSYCAPARSAGPSEPTAPGQFALDELQAHLPACGLSAKTSVLGLIGNPARHSWSPRLHSAGLRRLGADAVYVACEAFDFERFMTLFALPTYEGFSVTAPFKEQAARLPATPDEAVMRTRSLNTLARLNGLWHGRNTDVLGAREALRRAFGRMVTERPLEGLRILVLGAGGAARAVLEAVRGGGGLPLVTARDPAKAAALAQEFGARAIGLEEVGGIPWDGLVHCTPQGSRADPGRMPIEPRFLHAGTVVLDAVYRPRETPLVIAARARGCRAFGGAEWFVLQAVQQFMLFTGPGLDGKPKFGRQLGESEVETLFRQTLERLYAEDKA